MGTSTFAEAAVLPEIALAKVNPEAPLEGCAPFACGLSTGIGAALNTARCEAGVDGRRFRRGPRRARRRDRRAARRCRADHRDRPLRGAPRQARHHGATDTRVADEDTVEWIRSETGGFGADYTIEATGNVAVMRQAVESAREAWGLATMCGVAGKGEVLEVVPRFLITGRRVTGSSFGGVKGRTQVPQYVERWLRGEIDVESLISHRLTLDEVNRGFELMEAQDGIRSVIDLRMTIVVGIILSVVAFVSASVVIGASSGRPGRTARRTLPSRSGSGSAARRASASSLY